MRADVVGEFNEYRVLEYLREHLEGTRTDLARSLDLSPASVSRIVVRLLERGMIEESSTTSNAGRGRPSTVLRLVLDRSAVVGIDLRVTKCHGVLSVLSGEAIEDITVQNDDAGGAFDALAQVWDRLEDAAQRRGLTIGSLVVGVPAVVDPDTGLARQGPNVGWDNFDIVSKLDAFGVPFVVDNDVNLAALGEREHGQAHGLRDFAIIWIGTGLGGAIVSSGRLARGRHHSGGELGTIVPSPACLRDHRREGEGALESVLSGAGISAAGRALLREHPSAAAEFGEAARPQDIFAAASNGSPHARALVDRIVDALALLVINIASMTDPEAIILDGGVGRNLDPFLDEVRPLVAAHISAPPRLSVSTLDATATIKGATSLAMTTFRQLDAPEIIATLNSERD